MTKVTNNDAATSYANFFKGWDVKRLGPKPAAEMLHAIHMLGARPGKQALANAMALRECGVTGAQIVMACGAPQLNKMRGFITDALLKRLPAPADAAGHTVYRLELTAKGKQRISATEARAAKLAAAGEAKAADKPAKAVKAAAGKRKPAKAATVPAAETATSEPANATEAPTS